MDIDAVKVHVTNPDEFVLKTEEMGAQHFSASTFTLPPLGPSVNGPVQVLQLDPLRKRAVVSLNGAGEIILAHSRQQADSLQANTDQQADDGCVITSPATVTVEGTGPLWAVGIGTGNVTQQSVTGFGSVTSPGAGAEIATIPAGSLPAGTYEVYLLTYLDGTLVTAADENNLQLESGEIAVTQLLQPAPSSGNGFVVPSGPYVINVNGSQDISVNAIGAGTAGAKYNAQITAVPLLTSSGLSVGVLQERADR